MNKKILNLLVALAMVSVCFFQSCKDQSEDILIAANAESSSAIEQTKKDLETKITALEAALEAKKCECDMTPYALKADVEAQIALLQTAIDGLKDQVIALETTLAATNATVADVVTRLGEAEAAIIAANARIDEVNSIAEAAAAQAGVNAEKIANLEPRVSVLETKVAEALAKAEAADAKAEANAEKIAALEELAAQLDQKIDDEAAALRQELAAEAAAIRKETIEAVALAKAAVVAYVNGLVEALNDRITATENSIAALDGRVNALELEVEDLQEAVADLQDQIDTLVDLVEQVEAALDLVLNKIEELTDVINDLGEKIEALEEEIAKIENALAKLITGIEVQAAYNPVVGSLNTPFGISTNVLMGYYGKMINRVSFPYDSFGDNADAVESFVAGFENEFETNTTDVTIVSDDAANAGTLYLTINPTDKDFSGAVLPLVNSRGVESGVKLSEIQLSDELITFGYTRGAEGFYEAQAHISASDIDEGNVETLRADLSDLASDVKNALKDPSLSDVKSLAKTFGKTINQFNNQLSANAVKASWTDSLGTHSVVSKYELAAFAVKPLAMTALDNLSDIEKAPGIGTIENALDRVLGAVKNVNINGMNINLSDLKFDAISLNQDSIEVPVSFTETINYHLKLDSIPVHINKEVPFTATTNSTVVTTKADTIITSVDVPYSYEKATSVDNYGNITTLTVNDTVSVDVEVIVDPQTVTVPSVGVDGTVTIDEIVYVNIERDIEIPVTVSTSVKIPVDDVMGDVLDQVNGQLGGINSFVDQLNGLMDTYDTVISRVEDVQNSVDRIYDIVDRLNDRLCYYINRAKSALHPVSLIVDNGDVHLLSKIKTQPTVISGNISVIPTTYTAEVIAPALKKYVAVTNVYDLNGNVVANAKSLAAQVNTGDLNTVVSGAVRKIAASGFQKGYIYEVRYSALDYSGNALSTVGYVRVK